MSVDEALMCADDDWSNTAAERILATEVRRLREENERMKADADRGRFLVERGEWFRNDRDTPDAHALLAIRLPYTTDLSCKAMREYAIDAARSAK